MSTDERVTDMPLSSNAMERRVEFPAHDDQFVERQVGSPPGAQRIPALWEPFPVCFATTGTPLTCGVGYLVLPAADLRLPLLEEGLACGPLSPEEPPVLWTNLGRIVQIDPSSQLPRFERFGQRQRGLFICRLAAQQIGENLSGRRLWDIV
jgi:hypothetical protein